MKVLKIFSPSKLFSPSKRSSLGGVSEKLDELEYLERADRKTLQKKAKECGIKANQKNSVLRAELRSLLIKESEKVSDVKDVEDTTKSDTEQSTTTAEEEEAAPPICAVSNDEVSPGETKEIADPEETEDVKPELEQSNENTNQIEAEAPVDKIDATVIDKERAPLSVTTDFQNAKPKIKNGPGTGKSLSYKPPAWKVAAYETRMGPKKPKQQKTRVTPKTTPKNQITAWKDGATKTKMIQPSKPIFGSPPPVHNVSKIIKTAHGGTSNQNRHKYMHKPMPMSKRNEEQMKKFIERQNKGRKDREQRLKRDELAHLVRSPLRY